MTTESQHHSPFRGGSVLLGAAVATFLVGLVVTLVGAATGGAPAAYGALTGVLLVIVVFAFGAGTVHLVAGLVPAASLLVALLTYTLQVAAMAVAFVTLDSSGLLDATLDRRWLAGAVIVGTLGWLASQIVLAVRLRLPAYDLPEERAGSGLRERPEAGAR
ncbi:hypothetical protein [Nocardioides donggukensis]|uniref:ATP synthase protein I n=1 Tax=Nocardioides donggukensis TaxID=2774019 RepID=A0A927PZF9_9ACTN|nr:hypothetical protein [Nocardioides donggukensis]MBD8870103.1 hypothetical protein [Nocardioides donggukensis]